MSNRPNRSRRTKACNPKPEEIRALRENNGLSQSEAARMAISSLRSWQNWESGERRMHPAIWRWFQCAVLEANNPARMRKNP